MQPLKTPINSTINPGGSDRFFYEDLENAYVDNLMSPKRESKYKI